MWRGIRYKSLWEDNYDGVARRGGFFYTGMIGNGVTPRRYAAMAHHLYACS